jgi:hypothetical protein
LLYTLYLAIYSIFGEFNDPIPILGKLGVFMKHKTPLFMYETFTVNKKFTGLVDLPRKKKR